MKIEVVRKIMVPWFGVLIIPEELHNALHDDSVTYISFVNGCGAADSFLSIFVPQSINGVDISAACLIHDCRYTFGENKSDKLKSDVEFLNNLNIIILNSPDNLEISDTARQIRFDKAHLFFRFVQKYGDNAFVAGKGNKEALVKDYINNIPDVLDLESELKQQENYNGKR